MENIDSFFENIVEEFKDKIYRICRYYVSNNDDVDDLYQDTLINIWNGLDKFRGEAAVSTWIFKVTTNTALHFLSKKKAGVMNQSKLDLVEYLSKPDTPGNNENIEILHRCIAQLPLIEMTIISLVLEEVPSKEIARIVGLTDSNVRIRIHRIKDTLRTLIGESKS